MSSDSLRKDVARAMLVTLFRVIGFAIGAILIIFIFSLLFGSGGKQSQETYPEVLPNHEWKIKECQGQIPAKILDLFLVAMQPLSLILQPSHLYFLFLLRGSLSLLNGLRSE